MNECKTHSSLKITPPRKSNLKGNNNIVFDGTLCRVLPEGSCAAFFMHIIHLINN